MVALVRSALDRCAPSQHLVGNFVIDVNGQSALSSCYVRSFMAGATGGPVADEAYENFALYYDELVHTDEGWQVAQRRADIVHERGDRRVLGH